MKKLDLEKITSAKLLVVGDVMLDRYWYGSVERISPEAPVPVVRITKEEDRLGGSANVAYNGVSLGSKVSLLSVVGDDETSHRLEKLVSETGIDPFFERDPQLKTTMKLRVIGRQQQLIRVDFENNPQHETLAYQSQKFSDILNAHQAVIFSDYGKGGLAHISQMIERARSYKIPVFIDPKGSDYSRYRGASVITPNRQELMQVVGEWRSEEELKSRAQKLRQDLNLDAVLLTRSDEGMSLYDANGEVHVGAQALEVFDVTGAGDTVIATLAVLVASGLSLRDAMPWANKAGGIVVGKFGTAAVSFEELTS
jgi:D-glycero-beta-D-manno-heptose-7-phosphate kinase